VDDGPKTRVLLVEDNQDLLRAESHLLRRHRGCLVVAATLSDDETLAHIPDLKPQVVVLDLDRPAANGLGIIPCLREALPGVGIIGLTVSKGSAYWQAARAAGADDVVCKPDMVRDLPPAIQRVARLRGLRRRRPLLTGHRWHRRKGHAVRVIVSGQSRAA
jgi:DNA-binding NarL/FixJ family response regulator